MSDEYWNVEFSAANHLDCDSAGVLSALPIFLGMTGTIFVRADNIFDALDKAKTKVKDFGFQNFVIEKAESSKNKAFDKERERNDYGK